jgi:hypothetical protein
MRKKIYGGRRSEKPIVKYDFLVFEYLHESENLPIAFGTVFETFFEADSERSESFRNMSSQIFPINFAADFIQNLYSGTVDLYGFRFPDGFLFFVGIDFVRVGIFLELCRGML